MNWLENAALYIKRQDLTRIIVFYELYKKIINVHGSIFEFGVRYGQDLALLMNLRGMLEPYNYQRRIIGFDTFSGFPAVDKIDNSKIGEMSVPQGYETELESILADHEQESPISQIKKFELIKGDVIETLPIYLGENPQTIISFAYFDLDIYKPTMECLNLCEDRFVKGSILAFDELNHPDWKGETVALKEVIGLNNIRLKRFSICPTISYFIVGE